MVEKLIKEYKEYETWHRENKHCLLIGEKPTFSGFIDWYEIHRG